MGIKDDGSLGRRFVERKTEKEVAQDVRRLERERDTGYVLKVGPIGPWRSD